MNVLITGGAGFIGTHTAEALHAAGHKIRILDCLDPHIHGKHAVFPDTLTRIAECIHGDVCQLADCQRALEGMDCVYHLASRTGVGQSMYEIERYTDIKPYVSAAAVVFALTRADDERGGLR